MTTHRSNDNDFGIGVLRFVIMDQLQRDVKALKTDGMKEAATAIAVSAERILKALDRVYTGRLAGAFGVEQQPDGLDLVNVMPYAGAVEFGRPPGPVAFEPILEWTRVKLFGLPRRKAVGPIPWGGVTPLEGIRRRGTGVKRLARSRSERSARAANRGADPDQLEGEAFAAAKRIRDKLAEEGTEPTFYMRDSLPKGVGAINRWVRKYLPATVGTVEEVPF